MAHRNRAHLPVSGRALKRPLPIYDVRPIRSELPGMVLTSDLLIQQRLASARPGATRNRGMRSIASMARLKRSVWL
jgi:hypothetical protein